MDFKYDIAMLLATRGRTESLGRSIRSLVEQAENIERVQLMFAFDRDDDVGTNYFATMLWQHKLTPSGCVSGMMML